MLEQHLTYVVEAAWPRALKTARLDQFDFVDLVASPCVQYSNYFQVDQVCLCGFDRQAGLTW